MSILTHNVVRPIFKVPHRNVERSDKVATARHAMTIALASPLKSDKIMVKKADIGNGCESPATAPNQNQNNKHDSRVETKKKNYA